MNLVYNIDFIPSADGRILHVFHYIAYLIYAVVGCGVQLDVSMFPLPDKALHTEQLPQGEPSRG